MKKKLALSLFLVLAAGIARAEERALVCFHAHWNPEGVPVVDSLQTPTSQPSLAAFAAFLTRQGVDALNPPLRDVEWQLGGGAKGSSCPGRALLPLVVRASRSGSAVSLYVCPAAAPALADFSGCGVALKPSACASEAGFAAVVYPTVGADDPTPSTTALQAAVSCLTPKR